MLIKPFWLLYIASVAFTLSPPPSPAQTLPIDEARFGLYPSKVVVGDTLWLEKQPILLPGGMRISWIIWSNRGVRSMEKYQYDCTAKRTALMSSRTFGRDGKRSGGVEPLTLRWVDEVPGTTGEGVLIRVCRYGSKKALHQRMIFLALAGVGGLLTYLFMRRRARAERSTDQGNPLPRHSSQVDEV